MYSAVFDDHIDEYTVTKVYDCTFDTEEGGRLDLHGRLFANRHKAVRSIIDRIKRRIAREQQIINKWRRELLTTADGHQFTPGTVIYRVFPLLTRRPELMIAKIDTTEDAFTEDVQGQPMLFSGGQRYPLEYCFAEYSNAAAFMGELLHK